MPAGSKHPSSGLQTTGLTTRGDFEITTSFEILRADRPESGYGLGASLCAQIDGRTMNALLVARRVTPDGKTAYVANPVTNNVSAVDVTSMKEVALIAVGYVPKRNTTGILQ